MENQSTNLMPDPQEILEYLGLGSLPDEQKQQVLEGIQNHFSELVVETLSDNLTAEQAADLEKTLTEHPKKMQERVREIASRIPGLYDKIQLAVRQELEILKAGYDQVSSK